MNPGTLNNLVVVLLFGALILLAFLKVSNPYRVNKKANFWFGLFLLVWSTFWMEEVATVTGIGALNRYVTFLVHYLQIYLAVFFYLSVVFYTNPNYKFHITDTKHFIVPGAYLVIMLLQAYNETTRQQLLSILAAVIISLQSLLYIIIALLKIRKYKSHLQLFSSDTITIDLSWLEMIIGILLVTSLLFAAYSFFNNLPPPNVYINSIELLAVFFIAYYSLRQKEIYPVDEKQRTELIAFNEEPIPDSKRKIISDGEIVNLKKRLTILMTEEKPYLDSELNLVKLADMMSISSHQLSYLINTGFNETFFQYINNYRVEKAKALLHSSEKSHLTILGIAFESGFNSKTSFNTTFKKITNKTPSEYKKSSAVATVSGGV